MSRIIDLLEKKLRKYHRHVKNWINYKGLFVMKHDDYARFNFPNTSNIPFDQNFGHILSKTSYKDPLPYTTYDIRNSFYKPVPRNMNEAYTQQKIPQADSASEEGIKVIKDYQFSTDYLKINQPLKQFSEESKAEILKENQSRHEEEYHMDMRFERIDKPSLIHIERITNEAAYDSSPKHQQIWFENLQVLENLYNDTEKKRGHLDVYLGTPKKWQIVDEEMYGKEQSEKIQKVIKQPIPDELDYYKANAKGRIPLPLKNESIEKWRDDTYPEDSVDYNSDKLSEERKLYRKFSEQRYNSKHDKESKIKNQEEHQ